MKKRLSDAVDEYLTMVKIQLSESTHESYSSYVRGLAGSIKSDPYVDNVSLAHVNAFLAKKQKTCSVGTMNIVIVALRTFFRWCNEQGYASKNLMGSYHTKKVPGKKHTRIPAEEFPRLLALAPQPDHRIFMVLLIATMCRGREIRTVRWKDIDLASGSIWVQRHKTRQTASLTLEPWAVEELRQWMETVEVAMSRDVEGDWYVVPAYARSVPHVPPGGGKSVFVRGPMDPTRPNNQSWQHVQNILKAAGYYKPGEGMHTIRRSTATAAKKHWDKAGVTDTMARVQKALGHSDEKTTRRYLDEDHERRLLERTIAEHGMFGVDMTAGGQPAKVINLDDRRRAV